MTTIRNSLAMLTKLRETSKRNRNGIESRLDDPYVSSSENRSTSFNRVTRPVGHTLNRFQGLMKSFPKDKYTPIYQEFIKRDPHRILPKDLISGRTYIIYKNNYESFDGINQTFGSNQPHDVHGIGVFDNMRSENGYGPRPYFFMYKQTTIIYNVSLPLNSSRLHPRSTLKTPEKYVFYPYYKGMPLGKQAKVTRKK